MIDETAGEVAGVGRVGRRVDEALTGAVRGDEVLQRLEALAEVGLDREVDRVAGHVGHEATHACDLTQLGLGASGAGVGHHEDGVVLVEAGEHLGGELVGALRPGVDDLDVALLLGQEAVLVVLVDGVDSLLRVREDLRLVLRDGCVPDGDGQTRTGGVVEAGRLDGVQDRLDLSGAVAIAAGTC